MDSSPGSRRGGGAWNGCGLVAKVWLAMRFLIFVSRELSIDKMNFTIIQPGIT
jgi:hypothetical protein